MDIIREVKELYVQAIHILWLGMLSHRKTAIMQKATM